MSEPSGSPPIRGVNGKPEETWRISPNCQPPASQLTAVDCVFGEGICHKALVTKLWRMSKSDNPRRTRGSNIGMLVLELAEAVLPDSEFESRLFTHVYEP